jgi:hypothetical protein
MHLQQAASFCKPKSARVPTTVPDSGSRIMRNQSSPCSASRSARLHTSAPKRRRACLGAWYEDPTRSRTKRFACVSRRGAISVRTLGMMQYAACSASPVSHFQHSAVIAITALTTVATRESFGSGVTSGCSQLLLRTTHCLKVRHFALPVRTLRVLGRLTVHWHFEARPFNTLSHPRRQIVCGSPSIFGLHDDPAAGPARGLGCAGAYQHS